MSKTIKELADALGVSKTAVRKHMTEEFRREYVETDRNGVITIDAAGCNLIAETMGKLLRTPEEPANQIPETGENTENVTIPRSVLVMLEEQLRQKDAQLASKDQQIADLTATVRAQADSLQAAQALHAGTMQQQLLSDGELVSSEPVATVEPAPEPSDKPKRKGLLGWLWN